MPPVCRHKIQSIHRSLLQKQRWNCCRVSSNVAARVLLRVRYGLVHRATHDRVSLGRCRANGHRRQAQERYLLQRKTAFLRSPQRAASATVLFRTSSPSWSSSTPLRRRWPRRRWLPCSAAKVSAQPPSKPNNSTPARCAPPWPAVWGFPSPRPTLHHWQHRLSAAGPDGLRAIRIGELRGDDPMQMLSDAIGRERLHVEAPPRPALGTPAAGLVGLARRSPCRIRWP